MIKTELSILISIQFLIYGHVCQVLMLIVKSDFWRGLQSPPRNRVSQYSAARALHNLAFCRASEGRARSQGLSVGLLQEA